MIATGNQHVQWPAGAFYWAVIDTAKLPRGLVVRREQLDYLFEQSLPLPVEELHSVYVRLPAADGRPPGQYLACGLERTKLQRELPEGAVTLTPAELPEWLSESAHAIALERLNLLTGELEPAPVRHMRMRTALELAAMALLVSLIVVFGLERRTAAIKLQTGQLVDQRRLLVDEVLRDSSTPQSLPADVRLTAELRTLQQTRTSDAPEVGDADATDVLTALLERWPSEIHLQTQSLSITGNGITIRGLLSDVQESQMLIDAFTPLEQWRVQQPTVRSSRDGVDVEVRLVAATEASP